MGKRKLIYLPVRTHRRTREPGAEYVYRQCAKMWAQRGYKGDDLARPLPNYAGVFTRGLITFAYRPMVKANQPFTPQTAPDAYAYMIEVEGGRFEVAKFGADYVWLGNCGLPNIPNDEDMIEIRLAV